VFAGVSSPANGLFPVGRARRVGAPELREPVRA
jgi:hypothetical protein